MTGKQSKNGWVLDSLEIVEGVYLAEYLAAHGLQVWRAHWGRGEPYPVLYVRPKPAPTASAAAGPVWDTASGWIAPLLNVAGEAAYSATDTNDFYSAAPRARLVGEPGQSVSDAEGAARAVLVPEDEPEPAGSYDLCAGCGHWRLLHTNEANPLSGKALGCGAWECICEDFVEPAPAAGGAQ